METQSLIVRDDEILGGLPVFAGTRIPIKTLFDYLKTNHPLDVSLRLGALIRRQFWTSACGI